MAEKDESEKDIESILIEKCEKIFEFGSEINTYAKSEVLKCIMDKYGNCEKQKAKEVILGCY